MNDTPLPLETDLVGGQSRAHDPITSQAAAALSYPKQKSQRHRLLWALVALCRQYPSQLDVGFTSTDIQYRDMDTGGVLFAIRIDVARRRLTDLQQLGWIEKSAAGPVNGESRWVLTAEARETLGERLLP